MDLSLPIHPAVVHFPIAIYFLELFFLFFAWLKKDDHFRRAALFSFRVAFLTMFAAAATGWKEAGGWSGIRGDVVEHFYGAVTVAAIQLARGIYWHLPKPYDAKRVRFLFFSALIGYAAVLYTGYHGGVIVYKH